MLQFVIPSVALRVDHKCVATFHKGDRELDRDVLTLRPGGLGACEWSAKAARAASDVEMYMLLEHIRGILNALLYDRVLETAGNTADRLETDGYRRIHRLAT